MAFAVVLELLDAHEGNAPFLRQLFEFCGAHHGSVFAHDLTAQTAGMKSCQTAQIHSRLSMSVSLQYAVGLCQKREHMTGPAEVLRLRTLLYNGHCRHGALFCGNAGGSRDVIDGDRKRCLVIVCVGADHLGDLKTSDIFLGHRHADQTLALCRHEIDILGRRKLCGADEISLVFTVGIIHDENDLAVPKILKCLFYCLKLIHIVFLLSLLFSLPQQRFILYCT